ncbi:TRAP transporter small permease [Acuticoccus mangrovi]|uniref:TRAP transporter small permease protein n=1 Tax=Acuticoccus mangrovi TaxID=2796142 RepID=A0A934ILG3_9HYPH|nr:TRAP transporter small permease [Acuticoccus mangrovi]MBJ3777136.1 TRAP transporter small permease [Acuticoccus mangrovi]
MDRIIDWTARVIAAVAVATSVFMTGVILVSVVMRYIVGAPLAFGEELVGLAFAGIVFLMLPYCEYTGQNIRITLLVERYPPALRRVADAVARLLTAFFCLAFAWLSYDFTATSYQWEVRTLVANLIAWPWMAIMPVGMVLTVIVTLWLIRRPLNSSPTAGEIGDLDAMKLDPVESRP